jgi:ferrochelatase
LASALDDLAPGRFLVRFGAKYTAPSIEDGVAELAAAGVRQVIGIVLTPHQSTLGSGQYFDRAAEAAAEASPPLELVSIASWHRAEGFARLLADRVAVALDSVSRQEAGRTAVFFTAHSLPESVVTEGDPYPSQVGESGADIADLLELDNLPGVSWGVAWQSAGRTPDPWIGPDLLLEIRRVAQEGVASVVVCPVGFVSDHLEVLYDLDIEAAQVAESAGVYFARTASLNDDKEFVGLLASVVMAAVPSFEPSGSPSGSTIPA